MGKYRYWWRPEVERAIKYYPALKEKKEALQTQRITANYDTIVGSKSNRDISRPTESVAIRETLPPMEEKIIIAVEQAILDFSCHKSGGDVLQIVKDVDFDKKYSIQGAADRLYISLRTATDRRSLFIYRVAKYLGY